MPENSPTTPNQSWSRSMLGRRIAATPTKPASTVATSRASTRAPPSSTEPPIRNIAIQIGDM